MNIQPLLSLAERIEEAQGSAIAIDPQAAAELRRLHEENQFEMMCGYDRAKTEYVDRLIKLEEVNSELLEALLLANIECEHVHHSLKDRHTLIENCPVKSRIVRAIAKAEGEVK